MSKKSNRGRSIITVCKDCHKRYQGCRADCESYKAESIVLYKNNVLRRDEKECKRAENAASWTT